MLDKLNLSTMKENIVNKYNELKPKVIALYTGPEKKKAITVTAIAGATVVALGGVGIHGVLDMDKNAHTAFAVNESTENTTLFETTKTDAPETTTVAETTTVQETTVIPEPTSIVEDSGAVDVIPVSELHISTEDLSTDREVINKVQANQAPALSAPLGDITSGIAFTNNVGFTTGVDVSKYQGDINWTSAKNDGIDFAFVKVAGRGYETGTLYYDSKYKQNLKNAAAAGVKVGAYFFSQATTVTEAREEASMIVDALRGYNITYPVVFDWETASGYRTNTGISKSTMTAMANAFCSIVEASGYKAMVYANTFDFERFNASSLTSSYSSWLARYPANYDGNGLRFKAGDGIPSLNYPFQIWQYSSTGRVNGIPGNVDMNVSFVNFSKTSSPAVPMVFETPQSEYVTTAGTLIDVMKDVKCYNCAGLNETSKIKCSIKNAAGASVTINEACQTAGKYTVTYSLKDFTGYTGSKTLSLYVKTAPTITLSTENIVFSAESGYDALISLIEGNLLTATDFTGANITSKVMITYPSDFFIEEYEAATSDTFSQSTSLHNVRSTEPERGTTTNPETTTVSETTTVPETTTEEETTDSTETQESTTKEMILVKKLIPGNYTITYSVVDAYGLSISKTINLLIE